MAPRSIVTTDEKKPTDDPLLASDRGGRTPKNWSRHLLAGLALAWSLFQLWVVREPVNDTLVRGIHLAFAMILAYLSFPAIKGKSASTIPLSDFLLALLGGISTLYMVLNYEAIAQRPGLPILQDVIFGILALALLLESSRRTLGPALMIIGLVFLAYCYFGPSLPDLLAHQGASVNKIINHMYLTTEGIFGVPLRVSASFVFLFVLFGALLDRAGAGHYFIQLAYAALGRFRGGPAKAAIAASGMTGMISGSSIANTVTTGTFTIPLMKKLGFPAEKAGAIEVAASTNGQLMPPIMGAAAFIIAEFLGISYLEVVKAAFIPAIVSYFGLFYVVHLEACKLGLKGVPKDQLPAIGQTFLSGLHYLAPVFLLIYSLVVERQSAGLAAFNAINMVMLIMVVQKPLLAILQKTPVVAALKAGFADLYFGLIDGARYMIPIALSTAAAGLVVGTITLTGLGQRLLEVIEVLSMGHLILVLLFTAFTSLVLGMGLPTTANYIVMASLTAPIIIQLGAEGGLLIPAIAAHLFVFYFGILADDTPPVGLAAYAASAIAHSDPIKTGIQGFTYDLRTAILPFMFLFNTDLILIHGIEVGGSPMQGSSWIWIEGWLPALAIFAQATLAMFAFVSAIMGWNAGPASLWERLTLLLICFSLFRPDMLSGFFEIEPKQIFALPPLFLYAGLYLWKSRRHNPGFGSCSNNMGTTAE
ncbi:MAG: TRAP transporter permease [Magnetococcales bacterium]|nr:TRAP transporter permease [Magnetococcales bacterium]